MANLLKGTITVTALAAFSSKSANINVSAGVDALKLRSFASVKQAIKSGVSQRLHMPIRLPLPSSSKKRRMSQLPETPIAGSPDGSMDGSSHSTEDEEEEVVDKNKVLDMQLRHNKFVKTLRDKLSLRVFRATSTSKGTLERVYQAVHAQLEPVLKDWYEGPDHDDIRALLFEYKMQEAQCIKTRSREAECKPAKKEVLKDAERNFVTQQGADGRDYAVLVENRDHFILHVVKSFKIRYRNAPKIQMMSDEDLKKTLKAEVEKLKELKKTLHDIATTALASAEGATEENVKWLERKLKKNDYYLFPHYDLTPLDSVSIGAFIEDIDSGYSTKIYLDDNDIERRHHKYSEYYYPEQQDGPQFEPSAPKVQGMYYFTQEELIENIMYDVQMSITQSQTQVWELSV